MLFSRRIDISILDEQFSLVSDETEETVQEVARLIDIMLRETTEAYPLNSPYKNLVLVALKLASTCHTLDCQREQELTSQKKVLDFINKELSL